ncbi:MAG: peptidoglycan synthetase [Chitinophagaceae bacterium]|nr:peptidoglycan synthetase [Chitinophagaceae bacterium]
MKIHFISIGGSVMHQLAIALKRKKYEVAGSDDEIFEPAFSNLSKEGLLPPKMGWFPEKVVPGIDAVILGMHAREDNPELLKAKELGLTIYSFPEYIYKESKDKLRVAVGGSHGKTSTTSMIMHVLKSAGKQFDYLVGASLEGFPQSVNITDAPIIICEADEYPASTIEKRPKFHFLFPSIAVLTGMAWDHINVFPTFEFYLEQFKIFINTIETPGILIYNETDEVLKKLVLENMRPGIRYQPYHLPTYFIEDGKTEVIISGEKSYLKVFGNHNLLNIQAAFYVCSELGISPAVFTNAIANFTGAAKRLEVLTSNENFTIYRDFAHAPSKVKASINAVKQQFPGRKLVAILELHTFSSLNENFMEEYKGSMEEADTGIVFYSSHALELKRMPVLDPQKVNDGFDKNNLLVFTHKADLENWLRHHEYSNTNILLMSSGMYDGLDIAGIIKN